MVPVPAPGREELVAAWRLKLEDAQRCYRSATQDYRRLLAKTPAGQRPGPDSELVRLRQHESEALAEYSRVLRTFTHLTLEGELPVEQSAASVITVIDDDESIRDSVQGLLRSAGYRVAAFPSAEAFLESAAAADTACLILDVRMPGMDGPELQVRLSEGHSRIPVIFITAHYEGALRERVIQAGALEMLRKPFAPNELLSMVQTAMSRPANHDGSYESGDV